MTVRFITEPIPRSMGKGKGGFRGKIVERSSRSFAEIAKAVAKGMSTNEFHVKSIFAAFMEEMIADACATGSDQRLDDYGTLTLNIRGRFEGVDDQFDPERHELAFSFKTGRRFKGNRPRFALENKVPPTYVTVYSVCAKNAMKSDAGCFFMVKGLDTLCNGKHVRMTEGDSVSWSYRALDGTELSGPCEVFSNDAGTCDFHWPEAIPDEAIGRDLTITFNLHGGTPEGTPVVLHKTVRLYAA